MMKQCALLYFRKGKMFVRTMSNGPGAYVGIGDPSVLKQAVLSTEIGRAVFESLSRSISTNDVLLPEDLSEIAIPTFRAACVKNWSEFVRGCKAIDVKRNGDQIELCLLKREGTNFGLGPEPEVLENPSAEELGAAIKTLFRIKSERQ